EIISPGDDSAENGFAMTMIGQAPTKRPLPQGGDDRELGERLREGDKAAFQECFERHAGKALAIAQQFLDGPRAEEIVQEVFVRLWTRPERFDATRGSMRNFILADTHGRAVDLLRIDNRRRDREASNSARRDRCLVEVDLVALERVAAHDVRGALSKLQPDERAAITLAYLGGRTYREVAAELNVPEGTIKSRIRSGLYRLRTTLDEWCSDDA
ncbi:MAG: sigma-70 family RNA polymerase sigma factor, partial [Actinomycetota bacterium]|nr:sigma-70 family RNA polymerase sigma factor [Actinomycetota bacterium]